MIIGALSAFQKQGKDAVSKPVKLSFTSKASGLTYEWAGDAEPTDAELERIKAADAEYVKSRPGKWKSPQARVKAENKLRDLQNERNVAQSEASGGIGGTALWASGELQRLSKEAKKALAPLDKVIQEAGQTTLRKVVLGPVVGALPRSGQDAIVDALPTQIKGPIKGTLGAQKQTKASEFITSPMESVGRGLVDPKQELYQQFGVAFDPKARPEERIGAGVNMIGALVGAGMKGKTISQAVAPKVSAKPPATPPVVTKPTGTTAPLPPTAGNNASINRRRIFEGRAEIESGSDKIPNRSFNPEDYDLDDFQESLRRRAAEEKPAPFDLTQQEAWIHHRAKLEELQDQLNARMEKGDLSPEIRAAYAKLDEDIELTDRMGVEAGTIASQAFAARKNKFDYSPANIKFKAFKLNGSQKLSPEVSTKLSTLLKDEKRFADAAEGTVKFTEAEAVEAAKYIESVGKGIRKAATAEQRKQALDAFRDGIRSIMGKASLGLDPMDLVTMAPKIKNLAKAWVAPGSKLDDVVDGVLADAAMIAKQDPKLAPVLLKPDGSLLLDREDVIRVLAGRHRDGVRALRDNIDIDLEAKRFEIDTLMNDIKSAAQYRSMGFAERGWTEFANLTRGLRLGFDLSPPLNQGREAIFSHPRESWEAMGNMFRAAKSEDGLNQIMGKIRTSKHYKLAASSKLKVNATHLDSNEIGFAQAALIGKFGTKNFKPGPASNRAMMGYLNTLRYRAFENMVNANLKMTGRTEITQTEADNIAEMVNTLTGVGTGKIANALQLFNEGAKGNAFTAPGYAVAKTKLALGSPLRQALKQAVATTKEGIDAGAPLRQAAKNGDVATFLEIGKRYGAIAAGYSTIYGLLALNGAKIDFRQNSPLSMQVKLPGTNAWIDPTGGLLQIVKLANRIFYPNPDMDRETQMQKRGEYGELKTTRPTYGMLLGNYMAGKLAPSVSSILKLAQGESYGKKYNLNTNEGVKNLAMNFGPLTAEQINDIRESAKGNPVSTSLMILATIFGGSFNIDQKEVPRL